MIALKLHLNQYSVLCHRVPPAANIVLAATECSLEHTSGWDFWSNCRLWHQKERCSRHHARSLSLSMRSTHAPTMAMEVSAGFTVNRSPAADGASK